MEEPLLSIITVTWNAASVIVPTLESVRQQSWHDFEHIIVDGASTDDTLALVHAHGLERTRILSERDKGLYDAMNKGIGLARGRYLMFLNAGDALAHPDALACIALCAQDNPGIIYGQTQLVDAERKVVGKRHLTAPSHLSADSFKHGMLVCHQAFIARRDLAPQYDLRYRYSADFDWCIRVLQVSPVNAYVGDQPIISYLNDGLTTANHRASLRERYDIMCHYYGTLPTMLRHVGFAGRHLWRKITS